MYSVLHCITTYLLILGNMTFVRSIMLLKRFAFCPEAALLGTPPTAPCTTDADADADADADTLLIAALRLPPMAPVAPVEEGLEL